MLPPFEALLVFGLIAVALVLFVSEVIPNDVTAIGVIFALGAMAPFIGIERTDAISGFSNTATITIVAMYMLSAGVQKTGLVQLLGVKLADWTRGDERRALAATVGTTGPIAGFINNTPVVAVFIPMITDLAKKAGISPSKLLLPLSYAAILGGTLTLIGTSTNLLASNLAGQLIEDRAAIGMFEFTALGVVILAVGTLYLLTVGRWLVPARIPADVDLVEEFELEDHLARVRVTADSPLVGLDVDDVQERIKADVEVLQVIRGDLKYSAPNTDVVIEDGDRLTLHGAEDEIQRFRERHEVRLLQRAEITEEGFLTDDVTLAKLVLPEDSAFTRESLAEAALQERYDTTLLAVRRGDTLIRSAFDDLTLEPGDTLLVQSDETALVQFSETGDLFLVESTLTVDVEEDVELDPRTPVAVATMAAVVFVAAMGWLSVVIAALGGVFVMLVTGVLSSSDAYDAVSWNIIFLLAGVIPLGLAMEATGGAAFIADLVVSTEAYLPVLAVMFLFYILTGLFSNVITPVATVVLMIPVAVDGAQRMGADEFSFLLAVMFAAATSFMTPVGYQTNLMVYGPGGYRFSDFLRVGAPLQFLLAVVTTVGIAVIWGV